MNRTQLLAALGALAVSGGAAAQAYPVKPVRVLVGFTAGGATDIAARLLAQKLSETIGQTVVVENRPGAGSMLAPEAVVRGAPDGYTLVVSNVTIAMPGMFKKLPFDVRKDLAPVSLVGFGQVALITHPSLPAKSVKELVALAKRSPGALNYASSGTGAFTHLAMALFETLAKIQMTHIPYKGSSQANVGVATGEAQLVFASPASAIGLVKQGRLRMLALSGSTRSALAPDVPTMAEAGIAGYSATSWYGMLAPAAAPRTAIAKLGEESVKALATPDLREKLVSQDIEPAKGGPDEFAAVLKTDLAKWEKVIAAAKIPPQ